MKDLIQTVYETRSGNYGIIIKERGDVVEFQYVIENSDGVFERTGGIYGWDKDFCAEVITGEFMNKVKN